MECIVLAGGLGTRLRNTIGDFPKCMAQVAGKPFLHYIFRYLEKQHCERVILSLGYKHEVITEWLQELPYGFEIDWVLEEEPLGTGGGIKLAMQKAFADDVLVLNGDTFFDVELSRLLQLHTTKNAGTTLALKPMRRFERYGIVRIDEEGRILSFEEKKFTEKGMINGGVYVVNKSRFLQRGLPEKFSFEKDYLEAFVHHGKFFGSVQEGYFIDIGIPEDYNRAQTDFLSVFAHK